MDTCSGQQDFLCRGLKTSKDASKWTCLPLVLCSVRRASWAAGPPGGWGTCGAEPPERPSQDRMTQTCGKSFVCAVLCHRVWGALLQDLNCPLSRSQNGRGIFLFPSPAFLLSCLCSGNATSFKCQSHTPRGKVTEGGPDMQDDWYLSCSGFPGVCTLRPFCMGRCSNSRVKTWSWG